MAISLGGAMLAGAGLFVLGGLMGQSQSNRQRRSYSRELSAMRGSAPAQQMLSVLQEMRGQSRDMPVRARRQLEGRLATQQQLSRRRVMEALGRSGISQASDLGRRGRVGATMAGETARQQGLMGIEQLRAGLLRNEMGAGRSALSALYPSAGQMFQGSVPQTYFDPTSIGKNLLMAGMLRDEGNLGRPPGVMDPRYL